MRIFIIGASGLIGKKLFSILKKKFEVVGTYTTNKVNKNLIKFDMRKHKISRISKKIGSNDIFIILSAYSNPGWISQNMKEAKNLNILMTKKLIDQIVKIKSKIVYMSSVEVFDGKKKFFIEKDKPNPLNYYGKAKYEIEKYIQKKTNNFVIFRTSWNSDDFLHQRCVIELTYNTIKKKGAKMAKNNFFSITYTGDTSEIIKKHLNSKKKIIHIANQEKFSRSILARKIKKYSKKKLSFTVVDHNDIEYAEPRSKINLLKTQDKIAKKHNFRIIENLIKKKVQLLDKN
jgi:dTDP-4-dehydrorhamnose reductase